MIKLSVKYLLYSIIMGAGVMWVGYLPFENQILLLLCQMLAGGLIYLLILVVSKDKLLSEAISLCKQYIKGKMN